MVTIRPLRFVLILIFCHSGNAQADAYDHEEEFCPIGPSVSLAQNKTGFFSNNESGYFFPREIVKFSAGGWRGCICDLKPCLVLCPWVNMTRIGKTRLVDDYADYSAIPPVFTTNLTIVDDEETLGDEKRFHFLTWDPCQGKDSYPLNPEEYATDEFYLLGNGSLFIPGMNGSKERFKDSNNYCLQLRNNDSTYTPRLCSPTVDSNVLLLVTVKYVSALVSVPFLIATVIVYSVLPELRNIYGTSLRCYLCCLIISYVLFAVDRIPQWNLVVGTACLCFGFINYFSFLASFFWLNVMCFDMWWRFGGFGSLRSRGEQYDRKKFIWYSIYAWGISAILAAICLGMEFAPGIPESLIRPGFRLGECWFSTKTALALYFYGPVGVTIASNICLFISTSVKILQHNRNTRRHLDTADSRRHDENKHWFGLQLKLFIVMGITWSTEIISGLWSAGPKYLWFVTDMVNAFHGILIFVIFVSKRSIWRSIKERFDNGTMRVFNRRLPSSVNISRITLSDSQASAVTDDRKNTTSESGASARATRSDAFF